MTEVDAVNLEWIRYRSHLAWSLDLYLNLNLNWWILIGIEAVRFR